MTTGLLITSAGQAAIATDLGGGADLVLTHVAVGDANGVPYTPNVSQVALVNELYRMTIASVAVVGSEIVVDAIMPADTPDASSRPSHGFNVWEIGLFSAGGTLIGVARMSGGYKPPPSSGQAAIATFRLKLAVSNPSAITVVIDPQAQIIIGRHVRPFWVTVDGVLNTPPTTPATGATYVIGSTPTGAWTGFANRLAQWVGVWSLATVPTGHIVCDNSAADTSPNRFLRRTGSGWESADVSSTRAGFVAPTTLRKQELNWLTPGGTANAITLTPAPAAAALSELLGTPLRFMATAANTSAVTLNVNGLGAIAVTRETGGAVQAGDWNANQIVEVMYDGTAFRLTAPANGEISRTGRRQVFTAGGTFTVPAGITSVLVTVIGGGGAGGATANGSGGGIAGNLGAGGGAGGFAQKTVTGLTPGSTVTVTVGAGGTPASAAAGGAGGSSSFGAHCSATGGGGGGWGENTLAPGGTGGNGTGGDLNVQGGDGGIGGPNVPLGNNATQSDTIRLYGRGGVACGGLSIPTFGGTGAAGRGYGTGGSGPSGGSGLAGGAGAPGIVIVEW